MYMAILQTGLIHLAEMSILEQSLAHEFVGKIQYFLQGLEFDFK